MIVFFFFLSLNASLHYNQRDGSFLKCILVSFLLLGILQHAPHLLRACHGCIMAYEGSQPSISRHGGFGLILSTYQVLSKEAFASATPFTTIKGVDKSKKKKTLTWLYLNLLCDLMKLLGPLLLPFLLPKIKKLYKWPLDSFSFKLWISHQSFW